MWGSCMDLEKILPDRGFWLAISHGLLKIDYKMDFELWQHEIKR